MLSCIDNNTKMSVSCISVLDYNPKVLYNVIKYRPWPSFLAVLRGKYEYIENDRTITVNEGEVLFLPKNTAYKYEIKSDNPHTMQLTFNIFPDEINQQLPNSLTVLNRKSSEQIILLFPKLLNYFNSTESYAPFLLSSCIYQCLGAMIKEINIPTYSNKIMPAISYIKQNLNSNLSIPFLSSLCNLSVSQFRRVFLQEIGVPPKKYINCIRADEARRLIELGEFTISEISDIMMFDSLYSFSRFFKKEVGISPNNYKNERLKYNLQQSVTKHK